jgi:hypothetical protein
MNKKNWFRAVICASIITTFVCGCGSQSDISFLHKYDGKYPGDVALFTNAALKDRLQKMLGARYAMLADSMDVESPISIVDSTFAANGCKKHDCNTTNYILIIDLAKDLMYAGIRQDGRIETYSENGSNHPYVELWEQPQE